MEDILSSLSEKQKIVLKQLRKNLDDILTTDHTDYVLVKFLRARNFDLRESEKIFRINYYNRRTFGINTILDTYEKPEVAKKYEPFSILGFAKNGSLIHYCLCGGLDLYGFAMSMSIADLCLYFSYMVDYDMKMLRDENLKTGRNVQEVTFVVDFDGVSLQQVLHKSVIEMGIDYFTILQETYPEVWCDVLVINAPRFSDKILGIFKPILRAPALEKLQIADKNSSKELLLKYVDEDVLPEFLGGKRVDSKGDPQCKEFVQRGGKIPEKFYSQNLRIPLELTDPGVTCVTISPRSTYNWSVAFRESGSKLRVQFRTNASIALALFLKEFGPDTDNEVLPAENEYLDETTENSSYKEISVEIRMQSHCTQEDFTMNIVVTGIYVLRFSNVRNWFTSRKLLLKSEVIPPSRSNVDP